MKTKTEFRGPKREIIDNKEYIVNVTKITHEKSKNEFVIKEIQSKGFIVWLTKTLGNEVIPGHELFEKSMYVSYGNLNEYR